MTFLQYLSVFRLYSANVLLLALGVTLTTSLLKKTVLKNASRKFFVFLPFMLGFFFYGAYQAALTKSAAPFCADVALTAEGGLATGSVATLYYLVYEQFLRKRTGGTVSPFYELLSGIVPEEKRQRVADEAYEGAKDLPEHELSAYFAEMLANACDPALLPEELEAYVKLMKNILLSLRKA